MGTCNTAPNDDAPRQQPPRVEKTRPGKHAQRSNRVMADLNLGLPELRISEMGRTKEGKAFLRRKLNEDYFMRVSAENATLGGSKSSNMGVWIARHFPLLVPDGPLKRTREFLTKARLQGEALVDTFTLAGDNLEGGVVRVQVAQLFDEGYRRVDKLLKDNGVRLGRDQLNRLWIDAIELGRVPVLLRQLGDGQLSPKAMDYLARRHEKFINSLGELGMGDETRKALLREAEDINHSFEDLHSIADLSGLEYGDVTLDGIGYMPRVFSKDFEFRLRRLDEGVENAFSYNDPVLASKAALRRSRMTHDLIVEDELVLAGTLGLINNAEVNRLRKLIREAPEKVTESRRQLVERLAEELNALADKLDQGRAAVEVKNQARVNDITIKLSQAQQATPPNAKTIDALTQRLAKVEEANKARVDKFDAEARDAVFKFNLKRAQAVASFDNTGGAGVAQARLAELLTEATDALAPLINEDGVLIQELVKLDASRLDALIDSGILSKVPIPTTDLADTLIKRYGLPYSGIDELLITDPHQAYQVAKEQTKRAMGKSTVMRGFYREALDNGWGVTSAEVFANPNAYRGWHKLDPDLLLERFGLALEHNPPTPLFVHPAVEAQLIGVLSVATDPATLNTFARVWQYAWKMAKEQVLTTSGFLGRQVWQLFIQAGMSGTNIARVIPSLGDWARFGHQGLAAFDDVAKVYAGGTLTKRGMVARAMEMGFLDTHQAVGVGTAAVKSTESVSGIDPRGMFKALNKWGSIAKSYGVLPDKGGWAFVEYGAGLAGRASTDAAAHVMGWGVWLEQAFKLAYLDTVMRGSGIDTLGQFLVGSKARSYSTMEDGVKNARDYFLDYTDFGEGDRWISTNIAPFWMYMSRSVPATVRHVLRNPQQYVTMQRLYHLANEDVRENSRENPIGGVAPWQEMEAGTIYLPHPDGDGRLIHIPLASVDPVADVTNRLDGIADGLMRAMGVLGPDGPRGFVEEGKAASQGGRTGAVLTAMLGQSFGPAKSILAMVTREDPRSGKSLVLRPGAPTPTLLGLEVPGGDVSPLAKFLIENTLPSVGNLNRWNPGGVFGRKERLDANENPSLPGGVGWAGNPRSDSDANYVPDLTSENPMWQVLKSSGITVNSIDLAVGMQYTVGDMARTAREVKTRYGVLDKVLQDPTTTPQLRARVEEEAIALAALYVELETGKVLGTQWLNAEGYMSQEQRTKAEKAAIAKLEREAKKAAKTRERVRLLTESLTR